MIYITKIVGEGTGLGLSIVRRLVAEINGTIEVKSQKDQGSVFRIFISDGQAQLESAE